MTISKILFPIGFDRLTPNSPLWGHYPECISFALFSQAGWSCPLPLAVHWKSESNLLLKWNVYIYTGVSKNKCPEAHIDFFGLVLNQINLMVEQIVLSLNIFATGSTLHTWMDGLEDINPYATGS